MDKKFEKVWVVGVVGVGMVQPRQRYLNNNIKII